MEVLLKPRVFRLQKQYPCPDCGKNFKRNSHLVRHKRLHTGEKPYKCPECGKNFRQSTDVTTHRRIHTGETPYRCNDCGKSFRYRTGLVKHQKCHEEEKTYNCRECGKSFSSDLVSNTCHVNGESYKCADCDKNTKSSDLLVHVAISATEEPYECSDCGKSFSSSFQLIRHRSLQNRFLLPNANALFSLDSGEEPLQSDHQSAEEKENPGNVCEVCDCILATEHEEEENSCPARLHRTLLGRLHCLDSRRLSFEKSWKQSGMTESESSENKETDPVFYLSEENYVCCICGNSFQCDSELTTHEQIHTGGEPFQCSICQKNFHDRPEVSEHQEGHSEEKPFKCLDCGKSFRHQLAFIRHQRLHPRVLTCKPGHMYFAVLPPHHSEVNIEVITETPETLGYNCKQKDPNSFWTMELVQGTQIYWAPP
ncbi:zinc finger protein 883-like [Sceloporus undulatus]|uniref:zinc finger protein 883-like n=1 Tax=Sceloporus undulatus TaxID=8520 RepID=UPI001C4CB446|nr:zinc finger protein 883-like [Sceloporus undulatus]XP_042310953.1 zinc finger protein 883-like [Sceloporus undulatus]XP_042310954.1 zinc finger protein 883-like [Sceloporus undulatus]XP_042310955.1 zinc finger protein 883-like [Sceloporus undulatus]XP_042310956.1 zinc finger protein 883-like [Sceloporus undulatus]